MKTSTLRLRRVRYKNGKQIEVFRSPTPEDDRRFVEARIREVLDGHNDRIAGVAIVVWAPDSGSTALMSVNNSSAIPSILVPDFVRNRLLAERIEAWTIDAIEGR